MFPFCYDSPSIYARFHECQDEEDLANLDPSFPFLVLNKRDRNLKGQVQTNRDQGSSRKLRLFIFL